MKPFTGMKSVFKSEISSLTKKVVGHFSTKVTCLIRNALVI